MGTIIIGVDCSTVPKKTGYAVYDYESRKFLSAASVEKSLHERLVDDLREFGETHRVLVCFDVPLGWPEAFDPKPHRAGEPINTERENFFRRLTDMYCQDMLGKRPFDIASDRIARTAYDTLREIAEITKVHKDFNILWNPGEDFRTGFIEVYPAAWLISHGLILENGKVTSKIKGPDGDRDVDEWFDGDHDVSLTGKTHYLDACICCLNGVDFLEKECIPPQRKDMKRVKKEGWIWFKLPPGHGSGAAGKSRSGKVGTDKSRSDDDGFVTD